LKGLDLTAGAAQHNMANQFMRGSASSSYESAAAALLIDHKADAAVHAEQQVAAQPHGGNALVLTGLQNALAAAQGRDIWEHLGKADGPDAVKDALNEAVK